MQMDDVLASVKDKLKELMAQPEAADPLRRQRADRDHGGRRQRGRQNDVDRQAGRTCSQSQGKKVVLGAADTFRAAAVEQLTIWAERLGAEIVKGEPGSDPASVAHRAVAAGRRDRAPTSASSTRPAACKRSRT